MNPAAVLSILVKTQGIAAATGQLQALDKAADKSAKSSSAAGKMIGLAFKATAVGAVGVGAGLIGAVKASASFEKQMSSLKAVTESNAKTMAEFKKQAIDAGIQTSFSAKQAAEAQTELAKGGLSVKNIMGGGLKSSLALAAAGNLDLGEAAATTANAMNLFGLKGEKSKMVADQLAMAANATTADVHDFSEALKQGGSVAKSAGLSFTQTNVALEALAAAGIKGSDAGTSLKTALLQMIAPSSTKAAAAMEEFGLKFTDANGNMKSMADISSMLRDKLGKMTAAQRTSTLATIVGTDGVRTLTSLYDAGPAKLDAFRKGLEKQGTAAKVAATMQDNLAGKLEQFKGTIETIAIVVGDKLRPTVQTVVEALTSFANGLLTGAGAGGRFRDAMVDAFNAVKAAAVSLVATFTGVVQAFKDGQVWALALAGALGGLALAFAAVKTGLFVQGLYATATAAAVAAGGWKALTLAMLSNPFVIVGVALAALGAALVVAYQKSETFRNIVNAAWASIKAAAMVAFEWLKVAIPAAFDAIKNSAGPVLNWLKGAFQVVVDEVSEWKLLFAVVATAWQIYFTILKTEVKVFVTAVVAAFKVGMALIGPVVSGAWEGIKQIFSGAVKVLTGIIKIFGGVLKGDFGQIWDGIKQVFSGAWDVLKGIVRAALGAIVGYVKGVPVRMAGAALSIGKSIADGIVDGLGSLGHMILDKVKDALDFVTDHLPGVGAAVSIGKSIAGKIGDGAGKAAHVSLPSGAGLAGGSLKGAKSIMSPFVSMAGRFGLQTSSGLRQGAITSSGNPSYHGSGNAVDESGSPQGMLGYFRFLKANYGSRLRELIYTPGGVGIKDGKPFRYTGQVAADHFDHVHVAFTGGAGDGIGRTARMGDGLGDRKLIQSAATAGGIDPSILWGVWGAESNFSHGPGPVSKAGARGPFQFMPGTADSMGVNAGNLRSSAFGAARYLGQYEGRGVSGMLAAYNAGPGGNPNNAETRAYIPRVLSYAKQWQMVGGTSGGAGGSKGSSKAAAGTNTSGSAGGGTASGGQYDPVAMYDGAGEAVDPFGTSMTAQAFAKAQKVGVLGRPLKGGGPTKGITAAQGAARQAALDAAPTAFDYLDANLANAQATETRVDDTAPLQAIGDYYFRALEAAVAKGDPRDIAQARRDLTGAEAAIKENNDALKDLAGTVTSLEDATKAHTEALKTVRDELKRQTDFAEGVTSTSNFQLTKTLADTIGGQIVGYGVAGRAFTPGSGKEYQY